VNLEISVRLHFVSWLWRMSSGSGPGVHARMTAPSPDEMRELVIDAWHMVAPKKSRRRT
jgi:hypothetical protein